MSDVKSPFLIYPNFLSPLMCDKILSMRDLTPEAEDTGLCIINPNIDLNSIIAEKVNDILPEVIKHYNTNILDMTVPILYELKQGANNPPQADNSRHLNGKWVQVFPRDISGYIALCNYNDNVPFDGNFEVYGGKYEFPQHEFGFNPQIGTLILHPSGPHFIHQHTPMEYGNLFYIQFFFKSENTYLYNPADFPGDYTNWFREVQ